MEEASIERGEARVKFQLIRKKPYKALLETEWKPLAKVYYYWLCRFYR